MTVAQKVWLDAFNTLIKEESKNTSSGIAVLNATNAANLAVEKFVNKFGKIEAYVQI